MQMVLSICFINVKLYIKQDEIRLTILHQL